MPSFYPPHTHLLLPLGVKRSHLLDARLDGGLLLELYSRDGVGTMISADFYEGQQYCACTCSTCTPAPTATAAAPAPTATAAAPVSPATAATVVHPCVWLWFPLGDP